jgi:DHA2 family multidrug resistance protein-like MFS transporter
LAAVVGPTLASGVLAIASWPWLFAINIPVGLAALAVGWTALPESPKSGKRLDWIAAVLNVMMFGLVITGVDVLTRGGLQAVGAGELALGAAAGTLLVRRSRGQARPLAPIDLLANPLFSLSVLTSIASFAAQMLALVSLPFLLQGALGRTQVQTGLLITPWPLAVGLAAPLAGRLADSRPAAVLSFAGLAALSVGLALLATLGPGAGTLAIIAPMAICGAGFGFFQSPNNRTLLSSVPMERSGAAGGMLATARLTGQTIGATAAAVIFRLGAGGPKICLIAAAVFAAVAALVSLSRLKAGPRTATRAQTEQKAGSAPAS